MIRIYSGRDAKEGAKIALANRLYVSGWNLSGELLSIRDGNLSRDTRVGIKFVDDVAVSVVILHYNTTMAFCRKSYRRNGFCSSIAREMGLKPTVRYDEGIDGSMVFWKKVFR